MAMSCVQKSCSKYTSSSLYNSKHLHLLLFTKNSHTSVHKVLKCGRNILNSINAFQNQTVMSQNHLSQLRTPTRSVRNQSKPTETSSNDLAVSRMLSTATYSPSPGKIPVLHYTEFLASHGHLQLKSQIESVIDCTRFEQNLE